MMTGRHPRSTPRHDTRMTGLELIACAVTLGAIIALVLVFLLVFHDFPLRVA